MNRFALSVLICGGLLLTSAFNTLSAADRPMPTVPDGFTIEKVAGAPLVEFPMMANFDPQGRLFIAESAGLNLRSPELIANPPNFIRMLEDTDGDGTFDKSTIFADKMTLPMGALCYRGSLYVAAPPSIWRLEDTDGDGVADVREEIVDTFGFSGNAASVHGCFLGPNGRIYWVDGRHGHEFKDKDGNMSSSGLAARIFSCKPDGSDRQAYCGGGMDNPVEIDFWPSGEMFGTVNILLTRPRVDCLMHWAEGGKYPHHEKAMAEFQNTGDLMPPMTQLGHVAVSGMMRYRSDALGKDFQNNIFTTLFNTHQVIRSKVIRTGATFRTEQSEFLVSSDSDFHPTDVLEDADGSLLVIDTGGWFRIGCPVSQVAKPEFKGAIYRIRKEGAPRVDDPRGLALNLENQSPEKLASHLDDSRFAVRERAIDILARQGASSIKSLAAVIKANGKGGRSIEARRNAVWSLSRIENTSSIAPILRVALTDSDETVRIAAARSLGVLRDVKAVDQLAALTVTDTPAVRRQSATALGRISDAAVTNSIDEIKTKSLKSIFGSLRKSITDRHLEHALIFAAIRIDDAAKTIPYLTDSSPHVRRAALIALDQMYSGNLTREQVTPLLDTDDPELQRRALEVISNHEGWAGETLTLLRTWLQDKKISAGRVAVLRGFLLAQAKDEKIQLIVSETLSSEKTPQSVRLLMLEVMHRSVLGEFPKSWEVQLKSSLTHDDIAVRLQAIRTIQAKGLKSFDVILESLARDASQTVEVRIESVVALGGRFKSADPALFAFLNSQLNEDVPPLLRLSAARAISELPLSERSLLQLANSLDAAGPLAVPVLLRAFSKSKQAHVGTALVTALQSSPVAENLSPDELARLLSQFPDSVQKQAAPLLKRLGVDVEKQKARLAELKTLLTAGDAQHGKAVFFGKKAACSGCHRTGSTGGQVGPDLTKIGGIRQGSDLLEAVAFPSASFARGFRSYLILTAQGKVHTGVISRQTVDAVYLRTTDLAEIRIAREDIDEMRESSTSIMPKGLEKTLSEQELRDLLAYLKSLK